MKWSAEVWEEEGCIQTALCPEQTVGLGKSLPELEPFLGCLLVYKGRFLCLQFPVEAQQGPHLDTEGSEVRSTWGKGSFGKCLLS